MFYEVTQQKEEKFSGRNDVYAYIADKISFNMHTQQCNQHDICVKYQTGQDFTSISLNRSDVRETIYRKTQFYM